MAMMIRLLGWGLFLTGASMFLFGLSSKGLTVPALIVMGVGTFCTMSCNLVASYADLRRRKKELEPVEPLTPDSAARARQVIRKRASRPDL